MNPKLTKEQLELYIEKLRNKAKNGEIKYPILFVKDGDLCDELNKLQIISCGGQIGLKIYAYHAPYLDVQVMYGTPLVA